MNASKQPNKARAARLAKAFEKAIRSGGEVEIFPGLNIEMAAASNLILVAHADKERVGGPIEKKLAHYAREALEDWIVDARNELNAESLRG